MFQNFTTANFLKVLVRYCDLAWDGLRKCNLDLMVKAAFQYWTTGADRIRIFYTFIIPPDMAQQTFKSSKKQV